MRRVGAFVGLTLLGGIVGGIGAAVSIAALAALFWGPFFKELLAWGIRTHDVGAAMFAYISLGFVGLMSLVATAVSLLCIVFLRNENVRRAVVYALNAVPGVVVAVTINPHIVGRGPNPHPVWSYPLSEVAIMCVGLIWARWLLRRAPRSMRL